MQKTTFLMLLNDIIVFVHYVVSVEQFKTWYRTMRTTLSRITRTGPSGSGVRKLTEREERTLQLFGFLEQHIVRLSPKCGRSVSTYHETLVAIIFRSQQPTVVQWCKQTTPRYHCCK